MNLPEFSVNRRVTTAMLIMIVVVIGLISLSRLGLDLLPKIDYPVVSVVTTYSGVAPEDLENLVTRPLEQTVNTVNRVKSVQSITQEGVSVVLVEFEWGADLDLAAQELRDRIGLYRQFLPDEASDPLVIKFNISDMPILGFGVTANMEELRLRDLIDDMVATRLERVDGVASVVVQSSKVREIQIEVNRAALQSKNLSLDQVVQALRLANLNLPAGRIIQGYAEFLVRTRGEYQSLEEIGQTVVGATSTGVPIYIKEIARVVDSHKDVRNTTRVQGKEGVFLYISKQSGTNTVIVTRAVMKELEEIKKLLPPDIEFHTVWDQARMIEKIAQRTGSDVVMGGLLAILLIFLFLWNWRPTLTIALAIPLSIIATFIIFYAVGYTLNLLTLGGLALGVGMLVDNAVVVIENTFRHLEEGKDRKEAARIGATEVGMAITASTLTTVAVFFPMVFVGGLPGKLSRGIALSIAFALLASLFVALTLVPMLASVIFKKMTRKISFAGTVFTRFRNWYRQFLYWALIHRKLVILVTVGLFIISLALIPFIGTEFMPKMDQHMAMMKIKMPVGTSLEETDRIVRQAEAVSRKQKEIEILVATAGVYEESEMDLAGGFGAAGTNEGFLWLRLLEQQKRDRNSEQILESIRQGLPRIKNAKFEALDMGALMMSGGVMTPIEIKVFGKDLKRLKDIAEVIAQRIEGIEGLRDVDTSLRQGRPEYQIWIDREQASRLGLPVGLVANSIQAATLGKVATRLRQGGDEIDVRVRFQDTDRNTLTDLERIPLTTPWNKNFYLSQVAHITEGEGPVQITREDQARKVTITANTYGRDLGSIVSDIKARLKGLEKQLPPGYFIEIGGQYEQMQETFKWIAYAFLLAVLLVYMVMASQFESLVHPFTIMFTIPFAFIGVSFALLITGKNISLPMFMGFIILVGIAVNNGIVLVDYVNQLRRKGVEVREAIVQASTTRLRPILITALTTIFGMLPMALSTSEGAEFRSPMAIAVIGGLFTTTILTLVIIPVIYSLMDRISFEATGTIKEMFYGEKE